jgi:putative Mg2+ transporter-C (MgtC) family protein
MVPGDLIMRLVAAALLGSLIGLERQRLDKAAGLRTHMLVSVGSALIMIVSAYGFDRVIDPGRIVLDPSRVAAQVVSGIGFLGAGTIVVRKQSVHGLTTAASVWAVSAIGLAAGGALYLAAAVGTATMLVILAVIKPIEDRMIGHGRGERKTVTLAVTGPFSLEQIEPRLREAGLEVLGLRLRQGEKSGEREVEVSCGGATTDAVLRLVSELQGIEGVREVHVEGP